MELVELYLKEIQSTEQIFIKEYGENIGFLTPIGIDEVQERIPFRFKTFQWKRRDHATPMHAVGSMAPKFFHRHSKPEYRFQIQMEDDKFDNLNKIKDIIHLHDTFKIEIKGIEADVKTENYYSNYYARDNISPSIALEMVSTGEVTFKMDNSY